MNHSLNHTRTTPGTYLGWRRLATCLIALTVATAAFARSEYSSIVVFGDSLSDTGRLFRLTHGGFPPRIAFFDGRQTNGPVWVEYLADRLDLEHRVRNYAVVGAMTGPSATIPSGNVKSDVYPAGLEGTSLRGQFAQYLANNGYKVDPDALYIVEGGANDLIRPLAALLLNPPDDFNAAVEELATPTVINLATIVGTLKGMGAQHIAVVNVPDLGKTPYLLGFGPTASYVVTYVVGIVNGAVAAQLDGIDLSGGNKIARIDAFGFIDDVAATPASFGFTNAKEQFMMQDPVTGAVTYAATRPHAAAHWFFWDDIHPTTRGHEFFAASALKTLRAAFPVVHETHGCHR